MDLFIVGDIHGCYYSFEKLLEYWKPEEELLIQVGDLISKGNHCPRVVELARRLEKEHGAVFLQGNHEYQMIKHFAGEGGQFWADAFVAPCERQYEAYGRDLEMDVQWMAQKALYWENEAVFVSHAGISMMPEPYSPHHKYGILWNRTPLKEIGKLQVIGHTPQKKPLYDKKRKYINVDTGAFKGQSLTAVRLTEDGLFKEFVSVMTMAEDIF